MAFACTAQASVINERQSLIEAIEAVRASGAEVTWSSRLVKPWMRVRQSPDSNSPVSALADALDAYGLTLEPGPGGQWLVVEGMTKKAVAGTDAQPLQAPRSLQSPPEPSLDEIRIIASRYSLFDRESASDQFLTGEEIRVLPHIADDAFRAFHRLPGAAANDFQAPFNLRGGAVEEVKVVLDGLELFEPYHMRTLFNPLSIVDPGIIDSAHVLSGGFTAQFGNHMSGVIDIQTQWPESEPVHQLGVSFVNSFFRSAGKLGSRGNYQVSARRGYLDLLADTVTDEGEELSPRYSDIFAKAGYLLSDSTTATAHVLHASDQVDFVDPEDGAELRGNSDLTYAWLTLDSEPNDRLRWTNVLSFGSVNNEEQGSDVLDERIQREFDRDVDISALQSDVRLRVDDRNLLAFGLRYRQLDVDYDYYIDSLRQNSFVNSGFPFVLVRDIETGRKGDEYGAYARYRRKITPRFTGELGLRWDRQTWARTGDSSQFSPRLNALIQVSDRTDLRLGWGHFYQPQGIHELQVIDGVTDYFPAERAEHRVVGIQHRFESNLDFQAEIYQKRYSDLRPRFENALDTYEFASESNFDRIRVEPERAEAKGVELTLRNRDAGRFNWWLSYTWSQAEDIIEGIAVPRSWDQRHALTGNLSWQGDKWLISLVGRYRSGWPRTPLLLSSIVDTGGAIVEIDTDLSQRNRSNYDDYMRFDVRFSRTVKLDRGSFQYYFEIFNLFNTSNECCVPDHDLSLNPVISVQPNIDDFLPFFPSFGFVWTFGPGSN
ncbi:MAG: TonB-dependent receptor plug domain-containing protein [Xanthomonadales bacterium]|nr:TonB-dependent receptor plug domain-containing protein [Xanthomonadales bacterium]